MTETSNRRYFDLSTLFALGIAALLLVSLPGGCGDSEDVNDVDDVADVSSNESAEPTPPPMMEIVDPEPGDLDNPPPSSTDSDDDSADDGQNGGEAGDGADEQDGIYVVQQGDTLYGIAVQFNVGMDELMSLNGMDDPNTLQVGQELQIP